MAKMYAAIKELKSKADKCAICRNNWRRRVFDHDHANGVIRGALCYVCNTYVRIIDGSTKFRMTEGYKQWTRVYRHRITAHMRRNLGVWPAQLDRTNKDAHARYIERVAIHRAAKYGR